MFTNFFFELKRREVPVSLREYLTLLEAMKGDLTDSRVENFYYLSRSALVKDERHLDRFDAVFGEVFKGIESLEELPTGQRELPEEWLRALGERYLTEEEKAAIEKLGGWDELMKTLEKRLNEQEGRHEGGNKWIGTKGTSPFGHSGYHPEGVRIGGQSRNKRAVKVWEQRQFRNLDGDVEIGTRNIKVALRKLRRFARQGAADEFDLNGTIDATARHGFLDVQMRPERRNAVKLLLFFDVGGSMDPYIRVCEELFSAVRSEFKHLEYFYFHNFLYDFVWKDNARRWSEKTQTWDVLHTYGSDYMVVFVGDASMSPYEITMPGGSVEYYNKEAGGIWMKRLLQIYEKAVWLNPIPEGRWEWSPSIDLTQQIFDGRMFPLTLDGLERAIKELKR
ncbi:MAG: VWA domain-containing protein [Parvularcula sp.]|nr:VWA domain-containing protein [Parvularcula sp.]